MSSHPNSDLFRQQAIDYHFNEPENRGITSTRPPWTLPMIIALVALAAALIAYVILADDVVHALFERLRR